MVGKVAYHVARCDVDRATTNESNCNGDTSHDDIATNNDEDEAIRYNLFDAMSFFDEQVSKDCDDLFMFTED